MDLRISIRDEDGRLLESVVVYQDGSDSEGAKEIVELISTRFEVCNDEQVCEECGSFFDDNPDQTFCKSCEEWGLPK